MMFTANTTLIHNHLDCDSWDANDSGVPVRLMQYVDYTLDESIFDIGVEI